MQGPPQLVQAWETTNEDEVDEQRKAMAHCMEVELHVAATGQLQLDSPKL